MLKRSKQLWCPMDVFKNAVLARKITRCFFPPLIPCSFTESVQFFLFGINWYGASRQTWLEGTLRGLVVQALPQGRICSARVSPQRCLISSQSQSVKGTGSLRLSVCSRAPKSSPQSFCKCLTWLFLVAIKQITASPWLRGGDEYLGFCRSLIHLQIQGEWNCLAFSVIISAWEF